VVPGLTAETGDGGGPMVVACRAWPGPAVARPALAPAAPQVLDDRDRGLDFTDPPRPGSIDSALDFAAYAVSLANGAWPPIKPDGAGPPEA